MKKELDTRIINLLQNMLSIAEVMCNAKSKDDKESITKFTDLNIHMVSRQITMDKLVEKLIVSDRQSHEWKIDYLKIQHLLSQQQATFEEIKQYMEEV